MEYLERVLRLSLLLMLVLANGCCGCWKQERIALLQLKASINHPNGSSLPSWEGEGTTDCCEWEGVECNVTTRRIIKLSLDSTREKWLEYWYLNTSVFLPLESLITLDLHENYLQGCIENEGFENLSRLRNLQILDLSSNYFDNSIISSLNGLWSLRTLNLQYNEFIGQVYIEDFDGLNNLEMLDISWNQLDSLVIREGFEKLSSLSNLQILDLSSNNFNNSIMSSLSGLSSLRTLNLQHNQFIGQVYIEDFDGLKNLKELDISWNHLDSFVTKEGMKKKTKYYYAFTSINQLN